MKDMITIQNLTKTYGKHRGVEDVTFSVREAEIFGFLGPNGAWKINDYSVNAWIDKV